MKPLLPLRVALESEHLLAPVMGGESRIAMRAILLALMGEPLTDEEMAIYREATQRETSPTEPVKEGHIIAGRRSGKSYSLAALAVYLAGLCDWSDKLSAGETGKLLIVAVELAQAKILLAYVAGAFDASPTLAKLIVSRTQTSLTLNNGIVIEAKAADFRALRGVTLIGVLADEIAFWRNAGDNSSQADEEIVKAIKPALITTNGAFFSISSPYARRGYQFTQFRKHFGPDGSPRHLIAKGPTRLFNPTIDPAEIEAALADDPEAAKAEWLGEFRSDVDSFVSRDVVEACISPGRRELARINSVRYYGFVDPSGGSQDSMTMAIAHVEGPNVVLDCIREVRPPFSPDSVVQEFCKTFAAYGVAHVHGDRYGGEWPAERFKVHGVRYEATKLVRSELYQELLPLLNARRVELLDHPRMFTQLCGLERRAARSGKDSINHAPGAHDDIANAMAGAVAMAKAGVSRTWNITQKVLATTGRPPNMFF